MPKVERTILVCRVRIDSQHKDLERLRLLNALEQERLNNFWWTTKRQDKANG